MRPRCMLCGKPFALKRQEIGKVTCLPCGDKQAHNVKHCVVPLNKSNYMLVTDRNTLKQLNPKRTT